MNTWNFELISGSIGENLQRAIEKAQSSHVFFHPVLVETWLQTYKSLRRLTPFIIRAHYHNGNEAILPMALWHKNWKNAFIKVLIPIGYSDFDYHDPIFRYEPSEKEKQSYWSELVDYLNAKMHFNEICIDGITDNMAVSGLEWQENEICPMLELSEINDERALMAFFSTSLRGDIRRQIRRLNEIGELKYNEYSSWDEIPTGVFSEFMRQHTDRWPSAYKAPHFHENLLKNGLKAGIVHFSTLSIDNMEIAWHLGFSFEGRYYYYMPAGNKNFSKYSPTKIHLYYLVRRAIEQNYRIYDHLRGDETYKSGWSNKCQHVNSFTLYDNSSVSRIKLQLLKMRKAITPPSKQLYNSSLAA